MRRIHFGFQALSNAVGCTIVRRVGPRRRDAVGIEHRPGPLLRPPRRRLQVAPRREVALQLGVDPGVRRPRDGVLRDPALPAPAAHSIWTVLKAGEAVYQIGTW